MIGPRARTRRTLSGRMDEKQDDRASRPDEENPEWTPDDFRAARPALEVVAQASGDPAAEALRRVRGRPPKPDRKINQTLRLDPDVVEAYRRGGSGWQTRINKVLRTHMPTPGHMSRPGRSAALASDAAPDGLASRRKRKG
jgi:uncharacterized protein (DUF4415 family)